MSDTIREVYVGYGALRDPLLMGRLMGEEEAINLAAQLLDHQLVIQEMENIPDQVLDGAPVPLSARRIMTQNWTPEEAFRAYGAIERPDRSISGSIYWVMPEVIPILDEYHLTDFGWYKRVAAQARRCDNNNIIEVTAHIIDPSQSYAKEANGRTYPNHLNDPEKMYRTAEAVRAEVLGRGSS